MKYQTHSNPRYVYCACCHEDITLESQEILDDKVLCRNCYELESGEPFEDIFEDE